MMTRNTVKYVPFVLCATGLSLVLLLAGCGKKKSEAASAASPKEEQKLATVEERMNDPEYVKQLDAQRAEMKRLTARLHAATNDAQRKAASQLLEVNRLRTAELIRARMANGKISK